MQLLLAAVACAACALASPVITLNLDENQLRPSTEHKGQFGAGCRENKAWCRAKTTSFSQEAKYMHKCMVGKDSAKSCALPRAHAWDHHNGELTDKITYSCFLVNNDGKAVHPKQQKKCSNKNCIDYNVRSEWLTKYDVQDDAGNAADTVIFATILQDHIKPVFATNLPKLVGEASIAKNTRLPLIGAKDNYDKVVDVKVYPPKVPLGALKTYNAAWEACDRAGMFGKGGKNNCLTKAFQYTVKDTIKPTIKVKGTDDRKIECNKSRLDGSLKAMFAPRCEDSFDKTVTCQTRRSDVFDMMTQRTINFEYTAKDTSGNSAFKKLTVRVIDELAPTVIHRTVRSKALQALQADESVVEHNIGMDRKNFHIYMSAFKVHGKGFTCHDQCDNKPTGHFSWATSPLDGTSELTVGTYVMQYTCEDKSNNKASYKRTIINVDKMTPVLNFLPGSTTGMTFEADKSSIDRSKYTKQQWRDPVCMDLVDGKLPVWSHVSWNGVVSETAARDLAEGKVLGVYGIHYHCKDKSGNKAPQDQVRTITIKDSKKPVCKVQSPIVCEASSKCNIPTAKCADNHDASKGIIVRRAGHFDSKKVGSYTLTYTGIDQSGNKADPVTQVVKVQDTLPPVIELWHKGKQFH